MDKKDIEKIIFEKELLYGKICSCRSNLIAVKSEMKYYESDLWLKTDWESVINGRATDKTKKAYVDGELRVLKEKVEEVENTINEYLMDVDILNDKLKYLTGVTDD